MTLLDTAHAAMEAAPDDTAKRMAFYERVADSELFLVLETEPVDDRVTPAVFEVEGARYALVFDSEDRMGEFTQSVTPFLAMAGRQIAALLAGQGVGLGVNLAVAPSSMLLPDTAVDWLNETLGTAPEAQEATPSAIFPPGTLPETLVTALDTKLATMAGLAKFAYLAQIEYENRPRSHVMAFIDAIPEAQSAIAAAISEALTFSGIEAGSLDVVFLNAQNPLSGALAKHGLRFDLPEPEQPKTRTIEAPGSNPDKPPILR
ncbi:MAG: SseB family protein [Rhodobacteraceae bacterium]|nr:SseB family protein [Paracoccaceae bacterium]